jgi:hypothetical protein
MFPRFLEPDQELLDAGLQTISRAERKLFELFAACLDDDHVVFHGVRVHGRDSRNGGIHDREIDFLIAHPQHGLLALEVKGGRIRVEGAAGKWTSTDGRGAIHPIKNPFEQVRAATYDLLGRLREAPELREHAYGIWYGVALPDVDVRGDLGPGEQRAIILDKRDLLRANVAAAVSRIYDYYRKQSQKPPGARGMKALIGVLARDWRLRPYAATEFAEEEEQFIQLTLQQYGLLEMLDEHPRALIAGCAGSGKTMLAVEKARRLAGQGQRVLLTCYNRNLGSWLKGSQLIDGVTISHFHSAARDTIIQAGGEFPARDAEMSEETYWGELVPNMMLDATDKLTDEQKYDAIIVDEGQDFRDAYWEPLLFMLKDPDKGGLYIFYDDSQRIYSQDGFPIEGPPLRLSRNLRSTLEIGTEVVKYYCGSGKMVPGGPKSGRKVSVLKIDGQRPPEEVLRGVLDKLRDGEVSAANIVVLTPHGNDERTFWKHRFKVGEFELVRGDKMKMSERRIKASTIHGFKGLERQVVILAELEELDTGTAEDMQLLYVALSRAKNQVIVLGKLPAPGGT